MNSPRLFAAALFLAVSSASLLHAQPAPPPPPADGSQMGDDQDMQDMRAAMEARAKEKIDALHDVLRITPDQESAFQAFVASMRPADDEKMDAQEEASDEAQAQGAMTTPERLDRMAADRDREEASDHAAFQKHVTAVKNFYAALSPEQRRSFDALDRLMPRLPEGGMEHGPGKHGMQHGPHHDGAHDGH